MSQFTNADSAVNRLNAAVEAFEKVMNSPEGEMVDVPGSLPQPSLAERVKRSLDALTESPAISASKALQSELNAKASELSAKAEADRAAVANPDNWNAPYPDVWIPFNDSLKMEAGFGAQDTITVGAETIKLPSRSATFTRASTATYIDKSGVLQTAAINEPRFEKEGLLIEGQSTNLMAQSNPQVTAGAWTRSANHTYVNEGTEFLHITGTTGLAGTYNASLGTLQPGYYTCSCWVKVISGSFRFGFEKAPNGVVDIPAANAPDFVRVSQTINLAAAAQGTIILYTSPQPTGGSEFIVGRVQIEALPFATSYIPTNGAAVTRTPDNVRLDPQLNLINTGNEMTISSEISDANSMFGSWPRIIETSSLSQNKGFYFTRGTSGPLCWGSSSLPVNPTDRYKTYTVKFVEGVGATYYLNSKTALIADHIKGSGGSGSILSGPGTISRQFYGHIRNFRIWHRALNDAQIKSLR
ncbi:phage head spike fiber domain-containing protein [Buttiauxella izardii]|uniref:Phage tail protein n=1 Tax=Buttiauxella izardii TaxID=82991 RepID=A0A3A5JV53_9ENTR|nr:hypothetical protein [Buttiauxella izardii]RJT26926.1 hypothetical protein D6029_03830 [Buttiauxella izardii]